VPIGFGGKSVIITIFKGILSMGMDLVQMFEIEAPDESEGALIALSMCYLLMWQGRFHLGQRHRREIGAIQLSHVME
jgi:hypothetical protein